MNERMPPAEVLRLSPLLRCYAQNAPAMRPKTPLTTTCSYTPCLRSRRVLVATRVWDKIH